MKKILFLIPNLAHGGAEKILVNLVNNMDKTKFDITVQTLFDVGVNRQYLCPEVRYIPGWKVQFRGNSHLQKLFSPRILYKWFIHQQYDIVVSYLEGITTRIISGCPNTNTKKVCWVHTEFLNTKKAFCGFRNSTEAKNAYQSYNAVIGVSHRVEEGIKNYMCRDNTHVLYNTNETAQILEKATVVPQDTRLQLNKPSVCSVGRLISAKGFDRLLTAHKKLLNEGLPHRIYLLGIGEQQKELERKISELGVRDSFILLGFQDNPYQYVSRCDLYVCSSRREGFSTAVTEALIVGTPVVSTDCSGARELLGDQDEYGLVVENSEEGIYRGMKRMLENPELLAHYKKQAQLRGQFFSREKTVKAVEDMLERL